MGEVLDNFKRFFEELLAQIQKYDFATALKEMLLAGFELAMSAIKLVQKIIFPIAIALDIPGIVYEAIKTITSLFENLKKIIDAITPGIENFVNIGLVPIAEWVGGKIKDALQFLQEQFEKIGDWFSNNTDKFTELGTVLGELTAALWEVLEPLLDAAWDGIKEIFSTIVDVVLELVDGIVQLGIKIGEYGAMIIDVLKQSGVLTAFTESFKAAIDNIVTFFQTCFVIIKDVLLGVMDVIGGVLDFVIGVFTGDWERAWSGITGIFSAIIDTAKKVWDTFLGGIKEMLDTSLAAVKKAVEAIWTGITTFFTKTWDNITSVAQKAWDSFKTWIEKLWKNIKDIASGVLSAISDFFKKTWDNITSAAKTAWDNFKTWIENLWKNIKDIAGGVWIVISDGFEGVWNGMVTFGKNAINKVIGFLNGLIGSFETGINFITKGLNSIEVDIPDWVPGMGGKTYGFAVPEIQVPKIPLLAKGGVLTSPRLVMGGEYAGAKSNPEIVTPQSLMYETSLKAQQEANQPLVGLLQRLIQLTEEGKVMEVDGYRMAKVVSREMSNSSLLLGI